MAKEKAPVTMKEKPNNRKIAPMTVLMAAALIIIIAANALAWNNRADKGSEISRLTGETAQVNRAIGTSPEPAPDLQSRLDEARAALAAAQQPYPAMFNRNDIFDYIIELSRECRVEVLPVSSQGWVTEKNAPPSAVLALEATVTGALTRVNDFIDRLQRGRYGTLTATQIAYTRRSEPDGSGKFSGDDTEVTAELSISIYALPEAIK